MRNSFLSVVVVSIGFCPVWMNTRVLYTCVWHPVQISRNYGAFINIFREDFVYQYSLASGSERVKELRRHMWQSFTGKITAKVVLIMNQV